MRRFVPPILVVLTLSGLASVASARSPKDPVLRSRPADVSLARSLLLAKADFPPGFRDAGPDRSGSGNFDCNEVAQPDLHRLVMTADVSSHDFQRTDPVTGFTQVSTEATLFVNATEAQAGIAWLANLPRAKLSDCFAAAFRAGLPKTAKMAGFHLTALQRAIGPLHIYVWELQLRVQRNGAWIPVDFVIGDYRRGRGIATLVALQVGGALDPSLTTQLSRTFGTRLATAAI